MKWYFYVFLLTLTPFISCTFSESERRAAEENLVADGILKSKSVIQKEKKYNLLINGKWILDKVYFTKSKEILLSQKDYVKWPDHVTIVEYQNGHKHKVDKYEYSVNNLPQGIEISDYIFYISDDLLSEDLIDPDKNPTGISFEYRILKINDDSLIVKYLGSSLNYSSEIIEEEDPFISYYYRVND